MMDALLRLNAAARVMLLLSGIALLIVARDIDSLLILAALVSLLVILAAQWTTFHRYALMGLGPTAIAITLAWTVVAWGKAADPTLLQSFSIGAEHALPTCLRLYAVGALFWALLVPLRTIGTGRWLRQLGVPGSVSAMMVSGAALVPELGRRGEQVVLSRRARGFHGYRGWGKWLDLPRLLRPIVNWALMSVGHRSNLWTSRQVLHRLDEISRPAPMQWFRRDLVAALVSLGALVVVAWSLTG